MAMDKLNEIGNRVKFNCDNRLISHKKECF